MDERYYLQVILKQIGIEGQRKLEKASVAVVGAGGLGCPAIQYLTAAGIGSIGIIDPDLVTESNLNRQVLYNSSQNGIPKVFAAYQAMKKLNAGVNFRLFPIRLTGKNAGQILKDFDVVVDATDNLEARLIIDDACGRLGIPFVYGAIHEFQFQLSVFRQYGSDGKTQTFRHFASNNPEGIAGCHIAGVIGAVAGIAGSMQALEVIKILTGTGETLSGKILNFDLLNNRYYVFRLPADSSPGVSEQVNLYENEPQV